ncbi:MAG: ferritin-like domain-containing protein [Deltaproteobacteria bacterium]|nr:ferritin-like domain-containing protein [Deltaproteobacteria bacterium]
MSRLRRVLARAVFVGVAATQNGCCCPAEEDPAVDIAVDRSTPEMAALIDRCEANPDDCEELCRAPFEAAFADQYYAVVGCEVEPVADGAIAHVAYSDGSACGRAPERLVACEWSAGGDPVDGWLARAAYLEAASVIAFVHLTADLSRHRAPRPLIAAAIVAAHDEIRHAATMRALIRGRISVPVPRVAAYRPASLRDLALLNAIEGCARETIGAAVNLWQARTANDPELRAAFADIARDEIAHAELSWAIHAWALTQLDSRDATAIVDAHRTAREQIVDTLEVDPATRARLGLPSDAEMRALLAAISLAPVAA